MKLAENRRQGADVDTNHLFVIFQLPLALTFYRLILVDKKIHYSSSDFCLFTQNIGKGAKLSNP